MSLDLKTRPAPVVEPARGNLDDSHATDFWLGEDMAIMFCGLVVTLDEDAEARPTGDFYAREWRRSATCLVCRGDV